jgi:hypothetical protein
MGPGGDGSLRAIAKTLATVDASIGDDPGLALKDPHGLGAAGHNAVDATLASVLINGDNPI